MKGNVGKLKNIRKFCFVLDIQDFDTKIKKKKFLIGSFSESAKFSVETMMEEIHHVGMEKRQFENQDTHEVMAFLLSLGSSNSRCGKQAKRFFK